MRRNDRWCGGHQARVACWCERRNPEAGDLIPRSTRGEAGSRSIGDRDPDAAFFLGWGLVDLYDAHNEGGLVDVEPGGKVVQGTTTMVEALHALHTDGADR